MKMPTLFIILFLLDREGIREDHCLENRYCRSEWKDSVLRRPGTMDQSWEGRGSPRLGMRNEEFQF